MADAFFQALRTRDEITITTTGRKTGRPRSVPVWFVLERQQMWLLPTDGSHNHWFRNLLADPTLIIRAGRYRRTLRARPLRSKTAVGRVAARFRAKYGREDVHSYYSRFDAAVRVPLGMERR